MRRMLQTSALALAVSLAVPAGAPLQAKEAPAESAKAPSIPPEMVALEKSLHPQSGDVRIPAANAVLHLGDRYYFLPAAEAKRVLTEVWGNPPTAVGEVLGLVLEKNTTIFDNVWGAVVTYQASGHVSDADANSQDYGKVLADMQASDIEDNKQRKADGYPAMNLVGWAQAPSYDPATHSLIWARELSTKGQKVNGLNYDVRLLGRSGVLSLNMVSDMRSLADVRSAAQQFGKAAAFEPGATYADFNASTDKSAEYGLAGLVAGGAAVAVAQKLGLFAIILKFGKLILIGLAAAGAAAFGFFRRLAGRKEQEDMI